jgi:predicted nuclease with TOPRIM domain
MKGNDGRLRVLIDTSVTQGRPTTDRPKATQESTWEINALREHVQDLREQLKQQAADHQAERQSLRDENSRFRTEMDVERRRADEANAHARDLASRLDTAHRDRQGEAVRLRQEIDALRTELARPWWRRMLGW